MHDQLSSMIIPSGRYGAGAEAMDQVSVVTGGSRGIGAAVAVRLARAGHSVAIGYEQAREAAERCADLVRAEGVRATVVQADTSVAEQVEAMFDAAREELGPITGL